MLVPAIVTLQRLELLPRQPLEGAISKLEEHQNNWRFNCPTSENHAKQMAAAIDSSLLILYGLGEWQTAVANRWRCQINENSKLLAFVNAFPEMNHNEVVGWAGTRRQHLHRISVLVFGDGNESRRMRERMRVTTELIAPFSQVFELLAQGESLLEKMLFLAHLGDYVSLYLAILGEQDPSKIDSIDRLKNALSAL
jgi:glucose/mannose-6-phosphate isomerase